MVDAARHGVERLPVVQIGGVNGVPGGAQAVGESGDAGREAQGMVEQKDLGHDPILLMCL
jgi:hypothetical protein